jgi:hypothetical protein
MLRMKILTLKIFILVFVSFFRIYGQGVTILPVLKATSEPLEFTINTSLGSGASFKLPLLAAGTYNFTVDWGDGNTSKITSWDDLDTTHIYNIDGIYSISIYGLCSHFSFNNSGDLDKLISLESFGSVGLTYIGYAFQNCVNVSGSIPKFPETITVLDPNAFRQSTFQSVDLTGIIQIKNAVFYICSSFSGDLIIPSSVTFLGNDIFQNCTFDGDLIINSHINSLPGSCFRGMPNIKNIYLNNPSLSYIDAFCFYQTVVSEDIFIQSNTAPTINTNAFAITLSGVIHVPVGATGYTGTPWDSYSIVYDL